MDWGNDFTLEFLELYQAEPCLWDPSHKDHKRKEKLAHSWQRLSESTGKSVAELKRKKDSLMATFRGYLRKKKASIQSGVSSDDVYNPIWFAYDFMESFLGQISGSQPAINTLDTINVKHEAPQPEGNGNTQPLNSAPSTSSRHRKRPSELRNAGNRLSDSVTSLKNTVSKKHQENEDECDLYAKILAKKLRRLPVFQREFLMHDIDGMVLNAMHGSSFNISVPAYSSRQLSNSSPVSPASSPHELNEENTSQDSTSEQHNTEDLLMALGQTN